MREFAASASFLISLVKARKLMRDARIVAGEAVEIRERLLLSGGIFERNVEGVVLEQVKPMESKVVHHDAIYDKGLYEILRIIVFVEGIAKLIEDTAFGRMQAGQENVVEGIKAVL